MNGFDICANPWKEKVLRTMRWEADMRRGGGGVANSDGEAITARYQEDMAELDRRCAELEHEKLDRQRPRRRGR